jgi:hypothetical protein
MWKTGDMLRKAWVVDYRDRNGQRHLKTFKTKHRAIAWDSMARAIGVMVRRDPFDPLPLMVERRRALILQKTYRVWGVGSWKRGKFRVRCWRIDRPTACREQCNGETLRQILVLMKTITTVAVLPERYAKYSSMARQL